MREDRPDRCADGDAVRREPSAALLDLLLRLTPVNALLFNASLSCDYAAPIDDTLLGHPRAELLGRGAAELLTPARNGLARHLRRAAHEGRGWSAAEYRFSDPADRTRLYNWSIHVDPVRLSGYRGVLMTWQDNQQAADERESLRREIAALRRDAAARELAALRLYADLRNAVTPVWGYLQMIVKRPMSLRGRSAVDIIRTAVLPGLGSLLDVVERLRQPPFTRADSSGTAGRS